MEKYNYLEVVTSDVKEWLLEHYEIEFIINTEDNSTFIDEMYIEDSVTGNASGSYTFNTWKAEENLCHNWDLIVEANNEIVGMDNPIITDNWKFGAEYWDVIIRCYLLPQAISDAIKEIRNENKKKKEDEIQNKDMER